MSRQFPHGQLPIEGSWIFDANGKNQSAVKLLCCNYVGGPTKISHYIIIIQKNHCVHYRVFNEYFVRESKIRYLRCTFLWFNPLPNAQHPLDIDISQIKILPTNQLKYQWEFLDYTHFDTSELFSHLMNEWMNEWMNNIQHVCFCFVKHISLSHS